MLTTLAFDTATEIASVAIVRGDDVLGERETLARRVLEEIDRLLRELGVRPSELDRLVIGTGPGSFTSTRIGIAVARGLALALDLPVAGVSTLDALAAGMPGALPVIDARRREVFVPGPRAVDPDALALEPGTTCVGDGARRYRALLEEKGAIVPPDDSELHVPRGSLHARLARDYGPAGAVLPVYVRAPDADRTLA